MLRHYATLFIGLLLLGNTCQAALGEKRAPSVSAPSDSVTQRRAQTPAVQAAGVSRQSTVLPTGTTLVEYLDASGTVFAVSWTGPVLPDLPDTLGRYFPQFTAETQRLGRAARAGGVLNLRTADLVVHSQGRMRHFSGYAYVPGLVPAGLDVQDALR